MGSQHLAFAQISSFESSQQYLCRQSLFHRPRCGVRVVWPSQDTTSMSTPPCMETPPTPRMRTETPEHPNQDAKHIQRPHTMVLHKQNQVSSTMTRDKCSPCNGVNFWVVIFGVFLPFGSIYLFQIEKYICLIIDKYICLIFRNAFA